jgi:drug/metabolite transporter (DMT)-like permease
MKYYSYIVLAAILSGTVGVLVKLIGNDVHFMTLNFYRVFFAFLFLLCVVPIIDKKTFKVKKRDMKGYFIIGLLIAVVLSLVNVSFIFAPIENVVLIGSILPFFVMLFSFYLLKEKITITKIVTLVIALIGLIIINPFDFGRIYAVGNVLALVAAFFGGMLIVGMRLEDRNHDIGDVFWFFLFACLLLLPFPFIYGFGDLDLDTMGYVLALGVISTGIVHLLWNLGLQKVEAESMSLTRTIINPIVSIVLAVLILSEEINMRIIFGGGILVFAGIYLEAHRKRLKKR